MTARTAVVGCGAAGLAAALAAQGGVLLLEACEKPARRLLATGNGRCNLSNLDISPKHYHGDVSLAEPFLNRWPSDRVTDFFQGLGLLTCADGEGRVYPLNRQAAAVRDALLEACKESGVRTEYGFRVEKLSREKSGFLLTDAAGRTVRAKNVVLACGGRASPKLSGGSGYELARSLGHTVTPLSPSLVGLAVPQKLSRPLKGMRCKARASLCREGREVYSESGEVIFGDGSVSGICVMNLSARLRGLPPGKLSLRLDLLESLSPSSLEAYLSDLCLRFPLRPAEELFSGCLNLRVGRELVRLLGFSEKSLGGLDPGEISAAGKLAKGFTLPVSGTAGWEQAQVTAGGVPLGEVNLRRMESRVCRGLYLCGELLDLDGDCGGFNLHWAWATGLTAGMSLA